MKNYLCFISFLTIQVVLGQIECSLFIDNKLGDKHYFEDTVHIYSYVDTLTSQWVNEGFFFCGIDSIQTKDSKQYIYLHKGEKTEHLLTGKKKQRVLDYIQKKSKQYADHGYPFAVVRLDSLYLKGHTLGGNILVEKGPEIRFDTLHFFEKIKTKRTYLSQLLELDSGALYSETSVREITKKIKRVNFLHLEKLPDVSFSNHLSTVYLDISEKKSNTFTGVLGLQQGASQKAQLIGALDLKFNNLFRSGKRFSFFWERFSSESQKLDVSYQHPFLFSSSITPVASFNLLKQDSTFLSRKINLGIQTFLSASLAFSIRYERFESVLLGDRIALLEEMGFDHVERTSYGISLECNSFQEQIGLHNYETFNLSALLGNKQLVLSKETSRVLTLDFKGKLQRKIFAKQTLFTQVTFGGIFNDDIQANEEYRIGGLLSLRGFSESSLFVKRYLLNQLEIRSFFEPRSFVFLFYDQGFTNEGTPLGLGLGLSLDTLAGHFNFVLANGISSQQRFELSAIKIHFGYVTQF